MNRILSQIPDAPDGMRLTDIYKESAQFPGAVMDGETLRVHYQSFENRHDTLKTGVIGEQGLEQVEVISGQGEALYPVSVKAGTSIWYAWSETKDGGWIICVRCLKECQWSEILTVDEGEAVFYPNLFVYRDNVYLAWTRQHKNAAEAMLGRLEEDGISDAERISVSGEAYRINGCEGGDGNLYVAYDAYKDGGYHALARVKTEKGWSAEFQLDNSAAWACAPRIIRSSAGATVCWYTFDYEAAFSICHAELRVKDGSVLVSEPMTITSNTGWYLDMYAAADEKGLQVLAYTWGKDMVQVRYRKGSGPWSLPAQVSFEDKHCCVHPSLLIADGMVYLPWQFAYRNGHYIRNAQLIVTRFDIENIESRGNAEIERAITTFTLPIPAKKSLDAHTQEETEAWLAKNGYTGKLLFGDIHGQSNISDGMGFIDQYYRRSRAKANLQFSCLTDHDCYPDWISQSEWELMRTTARLMDTDNELTCMLSFEWTPNEYQYDFGHKNVYYRDDKGDIFRSGESCGITPTDLYASIKKYRAMCIPHHPAADWGMVSAATDWSFHDDEVERLAEIMSRHAPYEDDEGQSKYTKNIKKMPRHSVQEALAKGYRMGFTAGSDSHQMDHGVEGGIVAVYTDSHTRAGIWDSMYNRMTYGTTGARILLSFKANGKPMGSEIKLSEKEAAVFDISVFGTKEVKVELLRNNEVIQTWEPKSEICDVVFTDNGCSDSDYYYVRVTQPDEHMAWASPIWIDRK